MWLLVRLGIIRAILAGCGPLQAPIPRGEKNIDQASDEAPRPVDRFDHQGLLDWLMIPRSDEAGWTS
jgi:hypothetical protein